MSLKKSNGRNIRLVMLCTIALRARRFALHDRMHGLSTTVSVMKK